MGQSFPLLAEGGCTLQYDSIYAQGFVIEYMSQVRHRGAEARSHRGARDLRGQGESPL